MSVRRRAQRDPESGSLLKNYIGRFDAQGTPTRRVGSLKFGSDCDPSPCPSERAIADTNTVTSRIVAATDGSAINNPHGPAGWAWFVSEGCWAAGGFQKASNQVAEMFAVVALLRAIPREHPVLVRSDSQFTINLCTKWLRGWKRPDGTWRKSDGPEPANLDLVRDLDRALSSRDVAFEWVRGHSGDPMNEIADRICSAASGAVHRGETVLSGPGWTGVPVDLVIPKVGPDRRKSAAPSNRASAKPPARAATQAARPPRLVGERIDPARLQSEGWGANATIRRVTATPPRSPERPKMEICKSCDGAINPLTFHCRCGSM